MNEEEQSLFMGMFLCDDTSSPLSTLPFHAPGVDDNQKKIRAKNTSAGAMVCLCGCGVNTCVWLSSVSYWG